MIALPANVPPRTRGARRQYGNRAQRGVGRAARSGRSYCRGRRGRGRLSCCLAVRPHPRRAGDALRYRSLARRRSPRRSASASPRPTRRTRDCDLVVHASGTPQGLSAAIGLAGNEASILELSWYGAGETPVSLGGCFHSRRLKLISSQVGQVAPSHRPRWTHRRRLEAAISLLSDPALDVLIAPAIALRGFAETLAGCAQGRKRDIVPACRLPVR